MSIHLRKFALWIVSAAAGMVLGYWLLYPVIVPPVEPLANWLLPILMRLGGGLANLGAQEFFVKVAFLFATDLPNTLILALVAFVCMRFLKYPRLVIYGALVWPIYLHTVYWLQVWVYTKYFEQLGRPTDIERLPVPVDFHHTSTLSFLLFGVFVGVAVMLNHQYNRPRHNKPVKSDSPTSGAPVT